MTESFAVGIKQDNNSLKKIKFSHHYESFPLTHDCVLHIKVKVMYTPQVEESCFRYYRNDLTGSISLVYGSMGDIWRTQQHNEKQQHTFVPQEESQYMLRAYIYGACKHDRKTCAWSQKPTKTADKIYWINRMK